VLAQVVEERKDSVAGRVDGGRALVLELVGLAGGKMPAITTAMATKTIVSVNMTSSVDA
jgi:hypothetical protein